MKRWMLLFMLLLGVGIAFLTAKHVTSRSSSSHQCDLTNHASCSVFCCLPGDLELSSSQKERIQALEKGYCQCRDTLSAQIDKKRLKIADILLKPDDDLLAVESLLADIAKLQAELEMQTIRHVLEVKSVLPPEKQPQFIKPIVTEIRRRCFREEN